MPLFYAFHHYQVNEFYDLQNIEVTMKKKIVLEDNMPFLSSKLGHNHNGCDFVLQGKIKVNKTISQNELLQMKCGNAFLEVYTKLMQYATMLIFY